MADRLRAFFDFMSSISVFVSVVTYYLAWNKMWLVKHDSQVAASVSVTSYGIYVATLFFTMGNQMLSPGPWQSVAESFIGVVNCGFVLMVGLSFWVPGQRHRGLLVRLRESLRSERQHIGALARAFTRPAGTDRILTILTRIAMIDGNLDPRERLFIDTFAQTWGNRVDWATVTSAPQLDSATKYTQLRRDVEAYIAHAPPIPQALQLADVIRRLTEADGEVSPREQLIAIELTGLLERYAGKDEGASYEVHLVPQSTEQAETIRASFPLMSEQTLPSGVVFVAGTFYSSRYAEIVRREYSKLALYAAVERKTPAVSMTPEAE